MTTLVALSELTTLISSGSTPRGGAENYATAGEVMLIRSQNVRMNALDLDDVAFVTRSMADGMARTYLRKRDVLLNITGASIGRVAPFELETVANVNQHVCVLRPDPDKLHHRYLSAFLASPGMQSHIMQQQHGGTRQALTFSQIAAFEIPLPPLPQQRRIADILDKADAIRRKRKETIALTEELLRSAFLEMFGDPITNPKGWETTTVERVASPSRHSLAIGPFGSNLLASDYTSEGHPVVFVRDIVTERFRWKSNVYVSAKKFEELSAHRAESGDVLITKMGDPPGVACVMPEGFPVAIITADVIKVSVARERVLPEYLAASLNTAWARHQIAEITAGVTRAKITLRDFRVLKLRLPPLGDQERFVAFSDRLHALRAHLAQDARHREDLFASLVHRAFGGGASS